MSVWRPILTNLHELGRPAPLRDWDDFRFSATSVKAAVEDLLRLGLIQRDGLIGKHVVYRITSLGTQFCQGRVIAVRGRKHDPLWRKYLNSNHKTRQRAKAFQSGNLKTHFCATWLAALPTTYPQHFPAVFSSALA